MSSLAVLESQSLKTETGEAHASAKSRDEFRLASSIGMTLKCLHLPRSSSSVSVFPSDCFGNQDLVHAVLRVHLPPI